MMYISSKAKQPRNLVPYGCSTLPYQYQETANFMGTLTSAVPPGINPSLNSKFYIAWYRITQEGSDAVHYCPSPNPS
jgi:hypothetical protein